MKQITTHNLAESTEQEVFDFIAHHLLTQKEKAIFNGRCKYRLQKGDVMLKCAAGSIIPDDVYNEDMEGSSWYGLFKNFHLPSLHKVFIGELQDVHDNYNVENWLITLKKRAEKRNLSTEILKQFENEGI